MQMNLTMKVICLFVDIGIDLDLDLESDNYECEHASNYKLSLTLSLDLEIVYEFCMEIGPCAIGYRCPALVEIRTVQGAVRPVGTESSERVFFSLGNWRRVITLPFHTNFHDFKENFDQWEHNAMPS